ncbi:hypothetical protein FRC12_013179 [Ceratobasidium sp. 428]|nr:hypothetical protein FRC12_013179 [Ceratobasidium sp. 428]
MEGGNNNATEKAPNNLRTRNPRLWEGLPSQTNRYEGRRSDKQHPKVQTSVGQEWKHICHPEGQDQLIVNTRTVSHILHRHAYFYNDELRIVTEMNIQHDGVLDNLMSQHNSFVNKRDQLWPEAAAFDVFLDCSSGGSCRYYMIDHANKTICWLPRRTTADLRMPDVCNEPHLSK